MASNDDHVKTIVCRPFHSSFMNERKMSIAVEDHKCPIVYLNLSP